MVRNLGEIPRCTARAFNARGKIVIINPGFEISKKTILKLNFCLYAHASTSYTRGEWLICGANRLNPIFQSVRVKRIGLEGDNSICTMFDFTLVRKSGETISSETAQFEL